jgi:methionyl-tRNA formyltransferase
MLKKSDGALDFNLPAERLTRQIRAFNPWPGSHFYWRSRRIVVHEAAVRLELSGEVGTVHALDDYPAVQTSEGALLLEVVQPAGKIPMSGADFLRGAQGILQDHV